MPTQHADHLRAAHLTDSSPTAPDYSYLLTPPLDRDEASEAVEAEPPCQDIGEDHSNIAVDDNTAAGMSYLQEASMYQSHETSIDSTTAEAQAFAEKEKPMLQDLYNAAESQVPENQRHPSRTSTGQHCQSLESLSSSLASTLNCSNESSPLQVNGSHAHSLNNMKVRPDKDSQDAAHKQDGSSAAEQRRPSGVPPCGPNASSATPIETDPLNIDYGTKPWDFTYVPLTSECPSSLLHPGSKFEGTQQSDRQIYNVTVTIHTVDVPQSAISGYLKIEGLTEDLPTLTTFFTGEIIGGPNQKYSFQTRHADWGATDKTDLVHWARFPAWRPLSREAKRDINFEYPIPGTGLNGNDGWWQQEHIFMRWKEWFLVPNHRVVTIQGASFEGFYYICFNQVEGRISGIYFHAKSEKYQQLELKHEGEKGVWNKGVRPAMEFR